MNTMILANELKEFDYVLTSGENDSLVLTSKISRLRWKFNTVDELEQFRKTNDFAFHGYDTRRDFHMACENERFSD